MIDDGSPAHGELAQLYAIVGRREDAIRTVDRMLGSERVSKDVLRKAVALREAARAYVLLDDLDTAMEHLDRALSLSGTYTVRNVELDAAWDPLRDHPDYPEMIARYPLR